MRFKGGFLLPFLVLPFISGCMGGGGGTSSSPGPYEIAYILSENSSSNAGAVVEYALNPTNGSLYSGSQTITTGGSVPVSFLIAPGNSTAFVLNNNNPSGNTNPGSVASYTISSTGLSGPNPSTPVSTGPNPVNMAIDPGGKYLVVANHGNGLASGSGYVQVFSFSSNGSLTGLSTTGSPCQNPFRVVFAPHASGSSSDTVYVACTSPELGNTSTSFFIYTCLITQLESTGCTQISTNNSISLVNLVLDPSASYLVGPGFNSSPQGVLLLCNISSASPSCSSPGPINNIITLPSANVAFSGSGSTEAVYIGNYNSSSFNGDFASCSISSSSCSPYTISQNGPIAFATDSSQNSLYIVATQTSIPSSLTSTGAPSSGYLYPCPLPFTSSTPCSSSQTTGGWPVNISLDPSGNFLFVPTLSGSVSIFQVGSTGTLTSLSGSTMSVPSGLVPFSVTVPPNP